VGAALVLVLIDIATTTMFVPVFRMVRPTAATERRRDTPRDDEHIGGPASIQLRKGERLVIGKAERHIRTYGIGTSFRARHNGAR
jgi:hypothetical protein